MEQLGCPTSASVLCVGIDWSRLIKVFIHEQLRSVWKWDKGQFITYSSPCYRLTLFGDLTSETFTTNSPTCQNKKSTGAMNTINNQLSQPFLKALTDVRTPRRDKYHIRVLERISCCRMSTWGVWRQVGVVESFHKHKTLLQETGVWFLLATSRQSKQGLWP